MRAIRIAWEPMIEEIGGQLRFTATAVSLASTQEHQGWGSFLPYKTPLEEESGVRWAEVDDSKPMVANYS